jgi:hypothetical protein
MNRPAVFQIDAFGGIFFHGITPDQRWNGFACPLFSFEEAQRLVALNNASDYCGHLNYDAEKDTYREGDAFPGQSVPLLPGFEYDLIATDPKVLDSLWITVPSHRPKDEGGDLSVLLKRTHEGAIVDIQPTNQEERQEILATTAAEFSDATHPEEAVPA